MEGVSVKACAVKVVSVKVPCHGKGVYSEGVPVERCVRKVSVRVSVRVSVVKGRVNEKGNIVYMNAGRHLFQAGFKHGMYSMTRRTY